MSDISRAGGPFAPLDTQSQVHDNQTTTAQLGENNLSDVAKRLGLDSHDLQTANPTITGALKTGQEIHLPQNLASQGPGQASSGDSAGSPSLPPSTPRFDDPLAKGFIQSKLDGGAIPKETHLSADDLPQLPGSAGLNDDRGEVKFQPNYFKSISPDVAGLAKPLGATANDKPSESISLDFTKMKVEYKPQEEAKKDLHTGFDVLKIKPW